MTSRFVRRMLALSIPRKREIQYEMKRETTETRRASLQALSSMKRALSSTSDSGEGYFTLYTANARNIEGNPDYHYIPNVTSNFQPYI